MSNKGCVYYIYCKESGKGYVGQYVRVDPKGRWSTHLRNAQKGCKYILHQAIRKYGEEAFTVEVLCICPKESLGNMEAYYAEQLQTYCWDIPGGYNMVWCGKQPRLGIKNSEEMCAKISKANKGRKQSPEAIEKMRVTKTGRKLTPEQLEAHHKVHLGREKTPEELEKLRIASTGKKQTPEIIAKALENRSPTIYTDELRERLRQANLGRKHTEEARTNMSKAQLGRKHSEETLAKMREVRKGNPGKAFKKGTPKSEEWKEKMRKPKSEEHKEKLRLAAKARWAKRTRESFVEANTKGIAGT
jgi:group I intron endonuclease